MTKEVRMSNPVPKCHWCDNQATKKDYRNIDGCVGKIISCNDCFHLDTKYLLRRKYPKPKKTK